MPGSDVAIDPVWAPPVRLVFQGMTMAKRPGISAAIAIVAIVVGLFELFNSGEHLLEKPFWNDAAGIVTAVLTVLAILFALREVRHRVKELTRRKPLRALVGFCFWTAGAAAVAATMWSWLGSGGFRALATQIAVTLLFAILGGIRNEMDLAARPDQLSFDDWEQEKRLEADRARRAEEVRRSEREQKELEEEYPELKARNRLPFQARGRFFLDG